MKYKVSNVCQLCDKSNYPQSTTRYGITTTNNGDGTLTLNGICTNSSAVYDIQYMKMIIGHVYYLTFDYAGSWHTLMPAINNFASVTSKEGIIQEATRTNNTNMYCYCEINATLINVTIRPQLFDLTEMYGAGNEPTTVEEFRKDFPDDYYEYSPKCFEVIHKLHYINEAGKYLPMNRGKFVTETKNLISNESLINAGFTLKSGFWHCENTFVINNKILWENTEGYTGDITFSCYGFAENPLSTGSIQFLVERNDGDLGYVAPIFKTNTLDYYSWTYRGYTAGIKKVKWINITERPIYITKIMLEKSSTATDYHPYKHIAFN